MHSKTFSISNMGKTIFGSLSSDCNMILKSPTLKDYSFHFLFF